MWIPRQRTQLLGLEGPVVWSWYDPWTLRKEFENRYAIMSDLDHFSYTTVPGVAKLQKPALVIHGDNSMNAAGAKRQAPFRINSD